ETVEPHLICPRPGDLVTLARDRGIDSIVVPLPVFFPTTWIVGSKSIPNPFAWILNGFRIVRCALLTARSLIKLRIDLVQTNSGLAHVYGGLAARLVRRPCIWYFHEYVDRQRYGGLLILLWKILGRFLMDRLVGVSYAVTEALEAGLKGQVIYAGSENNTSGKKAAGSLKEKLSIPMEASLVGYIGRIGYVKGLDILLESVPEILACAPETHFVIFGAPLFGEGPIKTGLERRIIQLGLQDHWHWCGYDPGVNRWLSQMDLLVLPSRREALPLVLLHAGSAGVPVVASRVGGIPEIVEHGKTGLLVSTGSPAALAEAILQLISSPDLAEQMGRAAITHVAERFRQDIFFRDFIQLYVGMNSSYTSRLGAGK
ncbi:MAG: glycosyltransferase family 4 protein, partial [Anaerolineales bacterium]|nr:glycosyltransferase family 4 protein [Anaerolineales bacterium]